MISPDLNATAATAALLKPQQIKPLLTVVTVVTNVYQANHVVTVVTLVTVVTVVTYVFQANHVTLVIL